MYEQICDDMGYSKLQRKHINKLPPSLQPVIAGTKERMISLISKSDPEVWTGANCSTSRIFGTGIEDS
jgi:hypothetical protein